MPVRLLWPTLRTSERWQRARYFDRCFYISLLNLVDDYGRYEANPALLASECFPYGGEDGLPITSSAIDGALRSLASKDLLVVYRNDGKQFLELRRFRERKRSKSKWPGPETSEIVWKSEDCCQLTAVASKCPQVLASPSPSPSPSPTIKSVRFAPPTLEEVKLQGAKIGLPLLECEKFISYYESNGWKVGRNGMKSWQAAMTHWKTNWIERNNGSSSRVGSRHTTENPRNDGVTKGPTNYADAFKRKRERQDAEGVARQVAKDRTETPAAIESPK